MPASSPSDRPRSRLGAWRALSWVDRRRLLAFSLLLPLVDLGLRSSGVARTQRLIDRATARRSPAPLTSAVLADGHRLAELAAIAGRHGLYSNSCLRQALALRWWLRRQGHAPELCIGALKHGDKLDAHAWIELGGVPLSQPGLRHAAFVDLARALHS